MFKCRGKADNFNVRKYLSLSDGFDYANQEEQRLKVTCLAATPIDYKKECDYLVCSPHSSRIKTHVTPFADRPDQEVLHLIQAFCVLVCVQDTTGTCACELIPCAVYKVLVCHELICRLGCLRRLSLHHRREMSQLSLHFVTLMILNRGTPNRSHNTFRFSFSTATSSILRMLTSFTSCFAHYEPVGVGQQRFGRLHLLLVGTQLVVHLAGHEQLLARRFAHL